MLHSLPKFALSALVAATLIAVQTPSQAESHMAHAPLVIGHRGAAGYRPEHTIAGYTLAIEMGVDFIEPDLVLTKDKHMIARHEPMIGSTTDVADHPEFAERKVKRMVDGVEYYDWFASDFTLAEIKTLRAKERLPALRPANTAFDGQFEIPTLEEVIALAKSKSKETGRSIGIYPEIKHSTYHATLKNERGRLLFGTHYFEDRLLKTLHKAYNNSACAPVFIQSFEVGNLQYLSGKTHIRLVQLIDAYDVNDDGSLALVPPYQQPYDFVVSGDPRSYGDLVSNEGLDFVASYADAIGPWKPYLLKTVADGVDRDGNGTLTINDRRVDGSTGVLESAHEKGLMVHTWTFRNDSSGYGFADPQAEMSYYFDLGVDGLFTDFGDTGVAARVASSNAGQDEHLKQCGREHEKQREGHHKD